MADKHFLDYDGLAQFFNGLKTKFFSKTDSNVLDAIAKKHAHANKTLLDSITNAKVSDWDSKVSEDMMESYCSETYRKLDEDVIVDEDDIIKIISENSEGYVGSVILNASEGNWGPQLNLCSFQGGDQPVQTTCRVCGVATPRSDTDVANKRYVDESIKSPKFYPIVLNDDRSIESAPSGSFNEILSALIGQTEVYLKVWYKTTTCWFQANTITTGLTTTIRFEGVCSVDGERWCPTIILSQDNTWTIADNVDEVTKKWVLDLVSPVVLYDGGTSGVLAKNKELAKLTDSDWQISNLDCSPFSRLRCYIKSGGDSVARTTPPTIVDIYLGDRAGVYGSVNNGMYVGQGVMYNTEDRNVQFRVTVAVSADKKKICFADESSLYGTTIGGRNDNARYLYLVEGYYV